MSTKLGKLNNSNNIDDMLTHITNEKDKLEKLTKKVMNSKHSKSKNKNSIANTILDTKVNNVNPQNIFFILKSSLSESRY